MQEPPSSEVWEQLRVLLDKAPKRAREQVLYAYCRDHLASWPDEIERRPPSTWVVKFRITDGKSLGGLSLCNRIDLSRMKWSLVKRFLQADALELTRFLNLSGCRVSEDSVDDLLNSKCQRHLQTLDLSSSGLKGAALIRLIESHKLAELTALDVSFNDIGEDAFVALGAWPQLAKIKRLGVCCSGLSVQAWGELIASPYITNLEQVRFHWVEPKKENRLLAGQREELLFVGSHEHYLLQEVASMLLARDDITAALRQQLEHDTRQLNDYVERGVF